MSTRAFLLAVALMAALLPAANARAAEATADAWVTTWYASPQPLWESDFPFPTNVPFNFWNQTLRQVVRIGLGGTRVRVVLSNEHGTQPLLIGAARIALTGQGSSIAAETDRVLTFGGQTSVTIPPGAPMLSDPIEWQVPDFSQLSVSLHLPHPTPPSTFHWEGLQTAYVAAGDATAAAELDVQSELPVRVFLGGIQVEAADAGVVVALGDSITDGAASTPGTDRRWPDFLARRLAADNLAVVNAGISGGRVLRDRMGVNALARFDRDVLNQPKVQAVIVLMGINDISWHGTPFAPDDAPVDAEELIAGYRQLIARASARGVRIIGATLTPFEGALPDTPITGYFSPQKEHVRQTVNRWIRESGEFDAIIDFDALVRDPARPSRFLPAYDSGDHLHPGDAGYRAMADAVVSALLHTPR
jgi:lysophospholipase L1-like esterase